MSIETKILQKKEELSALEKGDLVQSNIGEVVFYEESNVSSKSNEKILCFVKEKFLNKIEFYRSLKKYFDIKDNQIVFPKHLQKPSFTLERDGVFSHMYDLAKETLNTTYNAERK